MIEVNFCLHFLFIFWNSKMPMKSIIVFFDGIRNENLKRSIAYLLKLQDFFLLLSFGGPQLYNLEALPFTYGQ